MTGTATTRSVVSADPGHDHGQHRAGQVGDTVIRLENAMMNVSR